MSWIDTHAHLDDSRYAGDLDQVLARAFEGGVEQIVTVAASLAGSRAAVDLAEGHPRIWATVGLHPHNAEQLDASALAELRDLAASEQVVAIGEIGLDYYRNLSSPKSQRRAMRSQLELANELGKPVVIHIRDDKDKNAAYEDALFLLGLWVGARPDPDTKRGVLHCFSGDAATAKTAVGMGFCLGVDGPVTYPNAQRLRAVVAETPLDRLLLETDCPYLAPQARRGHRNEPSYLPLIGQEVAQAQGVTLEVIAEATTRNARALFSLPSPVEE